MPTYSFLDVHVAIAGPGAAFQMGGSGAANSEEGISVEKMAKNTMNIGADGAVMHSLHGGEGGRLVVRLQKTSPINFQLSAAYAFQRGSSANWGQNTVVITDIVRGDVYTCEQVAFSKFPNNAYSRDGNMLEWEFDVGIMDSLLGLGKPDLSQGI